MALKLIPTHSLDAPIEVVLKDDDAWDVDRIEAERRDSKTQEHAWDRWLVGASRFDLRQVRHLLRDGAQPTLFRMRRLSLREWQHVETVREANDRAGRMLALRYALETIDVPTGEDSIRLDGPGSKSRMLTDEDMQALDDRGFRPYLEALAFAAWRASLDLTEPEKKA
jgi:hypothetical protein